MQVTHIHSCRFHFSLCVLNLFRLAHSAKCQHTPVTFSMFIFLWILIRVPAVSYISHLPTFLSTVTPPARWSSPENHCGSDHLTCPWLEKCCCLHSNRRGSLKARMIFLWRILLCGRKSVSRFSLVDGHLEAPAAGECGSGRADGWMQCGWWKSLLPVHMLLEEFAYWDH